jgi:hypothetical protein
LPLHNRSLAGDGLGLALIAACTTLLSACASPSSVESTLRYSVGNATWAWAEGQSTLLLDKANTTISPDGQWYAVGTWYALDLHQPSGPPIPLGVGTVGQEIIPETLVWAPGGEWLAFLQFNSQNYTLHIMDRSGVGEAASGLTVQRAGSRLAWLDDATLVYDDLDQLYSVDVPSGVISPLGAGRDPTPSPDGSRVAFELPGQQAADGCASAISVGVVNTDGSEYRLLLSEPERFVSIVGWSAGGEALIVRSRPIVCNALDVTLADRVDRIEVATGEIAELLRRTPDAPWPLHGLAFDPWADRVAFIEPECSAPEISERDEANATEPITWRLAVSRIGHPDERQVVATVEASQGCGFRRVEWVQPQE